MKNKTKKTKKISKISKGGYCYIENEKFQREGIEKVKS